MKNTFVLLVVLIACTPVFGQKDSSLIMIRTAARLGVFSPDRENEGGEKDILLTASRLPKAGDIVTAGTGASKMYLKDHPQAQAIASQAANSMKGLELSISLLPQHKYMITECLGIKASVGDYMIKLAMPFVRVDQNGLYIKLEVDKIVDNKVTVRTRPCYKDAQCHFSPQLVIGGTMTNVSLEITLNPIMDLEKCNLYSIGMPHFKWRIGGLNYKPLQNDLDQMVKNMMEDAMTVASEMAMPGRLMDAFNIIPLVLPNCGYPKVDAGNNEVSSNEATSDQPWEIKSNASLKGSTGRVIVNGPGDARALILFSRPGEEKHFGNWYSAKTDNFLPGNYDVTINGAKISGVPVEKGKDTRIRTGVLDIQVNSRVMILDMAGKVMHTTYQAEKIILPIGKYKMSMHEGEIEILSIKEGQTTVF